MIRNLYIFDRQDDTAGEKCQQVYDRRRKDFGRTLHGLSLSHLSLDAAQLRQALTALAARRGASPAGAS